MNKKSEMVAPKPAASQSMDDENGNCRQCGHPFNPHTIIAYDIEDFSKGEEMRCPIDGCSCFSTISFDFSANGEH